MLMQHPPSDPWEKKSRFLTQLLIWSGALNIGLLSSLIYLVFRERPEAIPFELPPVSHEWTQATNQEILTTFATLSWGELVAYLDNRDVAQEGYKKRDLALASLVAFHGLDIDKALQGTWIQKRSIVFARKEGPEEITLTLYPGLTEDQFQAVIRFIQTEKFPLTAQGLFYELQHTLPPREAALLEAFYLTPEFSSIQTLCERCGVNLPREFLIELITQGEWKVLHQFTQEQKQGLDLTPERLKKLLLTYTRHRSTFAAKLLLHWNPEFLLKRLEDPDLIAFLDLFKEPSPPLDSLLKELITSPRSDAVWKKAAECLYLFAQIPLPDPYDHRMTLTTFAGASFPAPPKPIPKPIQEEPPPSKQAPLKHTIQRGDNLWKIARRYKVSIQALREANHLESDKLREGKTLLIPAKGPSMNNFPS